MQTPHGSQHDADAAARGARPRPVSLALPVAASWPAHYALSGFASSHYPSTGPQSAIGFAPIDSSNYWNAYAHHPPRLPTSATRTSAEDVGLTPSTVLSPPTAQNPLSSTQAVHVQSSSTTYPLHLTSATGAADYGVHAGGPLSSEEPSVTLYERTVPGDSHSTWPPLVDRSLLAGPADRVSIPAAASEGAAHTGMPAADPLEGSESRFYPGIGTSGYYSLHDGLHPSAPSWPTHNYEVTTVVPPTHNPRTDMAIPPLLYQPPVLITHRPAPPPSELPTRGETSRPPTGNLNSSQTSNSDVATSQRIPPVDSHTLNVSARGEGSSADIPYALPPAAPPLENYQASLADPVPQTNVAPDGPSDNEAEPGSSSSASPQSRRNRRKVDTAPSSDAPPPSRSPPRAAVAVLDPPKPKKKMYICEVCNKSFDRPSTLKKHSVVHTRVKEYKCTMCGRLFNVQSNLNRHGARCKARPALTTSHPEPPMAGPSNAPSSGVVPNPDAEAGPSSAPLSAIPVVARVRTTHTENTAVSPSAATAGKKRSRKEAPAQPWIPASLANFDLSGTNCGCAPLPLPPVRPFRKTVQEYLEERSRNVDPKRMDDLTALLSGLRVTHEPDGDYVVEERDSYDENVHPTPYHPDGWSGRLPGPRAAVVGEVRVSNTEMQTVKRSFL